MAELNAEDISSRYLPYLLPALLGATVAGRRGYKPLSGDRAAFDWGVKKQLEPGDNILRDLKSDFKGVPFSQREPAPPGVGSPDVTPPPASATPSLPGIRSSNPGQGPAIPYSRVRDEIGGMDPAGKDWRYINQQQIPVPTPKPQVPPPSTTEEMAEALKGGGSRITPPTTEAPNIPRPGFSRPEGEGAGAGPLPGFLREEPEPMIMPPRGGGTTGGGGGAGVGPSPSSPTGPGGRTIPRWALPIGLGTLGATATASELGDLENKPAPPDYAGQAKRAFGLESATPADMRSPPPPASQPVKSNPPFDVYDTTTQGITGGAAGGISGSMAGGPPSRPPEIDEVSKYQGPDLQNKFPGKTPLPKSRPTPQNKPTPTKRPSQSAPQQSNPQADILRDFIGALFNKPVPRYQPPYPPGWPSSYRNE